MGVTAQRVGVHGVGEYPMGLVTWDPDRYASLSIPSDDYSYDIFTQAAPGGRAPTPLALPPGPRTQWSAPGHL